MMDDTAGTHRASRIIGIVALDRNNAIGKDGTLPWHYKSDMKHFREQTTGNVCVMGRRTWESLKRPLGGRLNVVLSRNADIESQPAVLVLRDSESVLALRAFLSCDVYIIGGAQVYHEFADVVDEWLVTHVPLAVEGTDTFMPSAFLDGFEERESWSLDGDLVVRRCVRRTID